MLGGAQQAEQTTARSGTMKPSHAENSNAVPGLSQTTNWSVPRVSGRRQLQHCVYGPVGSLTSNSELRDAAMATGGQEEEKSPDGRRPPDVAFPDGAAQ